MATTWNNNKKNPQDAGWAAGIKAIGSEHIVRRPADECI